MGKKELERMKKKVIKIEKVLAELNEKITKELNEINELMNVELEIPSKSRASRHRSTRRRNTPHESGGDPELLKIED